MNMELVKAASGRFFGRGVLLAKKHAPEILTGAGVVGVVTAAVMASRATLDLDDRLAKSREYIHDFKKTRELNDLDIYPQEKYQRDLAMAYALGAREVIKLYGPAVALGAASLTAILSAHGILKQRNAALVMAYNTLDAAFKSYRNRVVEEFGPDKDWDYRHGVREKTVENVDDNGKKTRKKELSQDPNGISQYARFFDEMNPNFSKNQPETNLYFLKCRQNYLNDKLLAQGHLFLNEVYDNLEIPRTKAGAIVGWVVSKDGDNFVDFGIWDLDNPKARDFVNGFEKAILLDFNVDGVIYDKI